MTSSSNTKRVKTTINNPSKGHKQKRHILFPPIPNQRTLKTILFGHATKSCGGKKD